MIIIITIIVVIERNIYFNNSLKTWNANQMQRKTKNA